MANRGSQVREKARQVWKDILTEGYKRIIAITVGVVLFLLGGFLLGPFAEKWKARLLHPPRTVTIYGTIQTSETFRPLPQARVARLDMAGEYTVSDTNGSFKLKVKVPKGQNEVQLVISAADFVERTVTVALPPNDNHTRMEEIQLQPAAGLSNRKLPTQMLKQS